MTFAVGCRWCAIGIIHLTIQQNKYEVKLRRSKNNDTYFVLNSAHVDYEKLTKLKANLKWSEVKWRGSRLCLFVCIFDMYLTRISINSNQLLINSHSTNFHGTKIQNYTRLFYICILLPFVWLKIHKCSSHLYCVLVFFLSFIFIWVLKFRMSQHTKKTFQKQKKKKEFYVHARTSHAHTY